MIRPTEKYELNLPDNYQLRQISAQHDELAALFYESFQGGVGEYGQREQDEHLSSITNYFETVAEDELCYQASSIIQQDGVIVASCLVQIHNGLPSIRFVVTHPEHQGKGLATQLMQHAMTKLVEHHSYIKLAVSLENPAHNLYFKMGFMPAETIYRMQYPSLEE